MERERERERERDGERERGHASCTWMAVEETSRARTAVKAGVWV